MSDDRQPGPLLQFLVRGFIAACGGLGVTVVAILVLVISERPYR